MTDEQKAARREQVRLYQKRRRAEHPESCRARDRARNATAERRAGKRASYHRHADRILAEKRAKYAADPQKALDYNRELRRKNPDITRRYTLKRAYDMSLGEFEAMRDAQGGACAICAEPFTKTPHVDHCHATGAVRALLCGGCNTGLGRFRDNPEHMEAAADYIRTHRARLSLVKEA